MYSEKFVKELSIFFNWIKDEGYIIYKGDELCEWSDKLLINYKEPGRNKIDNYIKDLIKEYRIELDGEECNDYKLLSNNFKSGKKNGVKKKRGRKRKTESIGKEKEIKKEENVIKIDNKKRINNIEKADDLSYNFEELNNILGGYMRGGEYKKYWMLNVGSKYFCIYTRDDLKFELGILYERRKKKVIQSDINEIKLFLENKKEEVNESEYETSEEDEKEKSDDNYNYDDDTGELEEKISECIINDFGKINISEIIAEIDDINLDDLDEDDLCN
jgi:hypothetical protein